MTWKHWWPTVVVFTWEIPAAHLLSPHQALTADTPKERSLARPQPLGWPSGLPPRPRRDWSSWRRCWDHPSLTSLVGGAATRCKPAHLAPTPTPTRPNSDRKGPKRARDGILEVLERAGLCEIGRFATTEIIWEDPLRATYVLRGHCLWEQLNIENIIQRVSVRIIYAFVARFYNKHFAENALGLSGVRCGYRTLEL